MSETMINRVRNRLSALTSTGESNARIETASGDTSLLLRRIAVGAFLFILGTVLGVFLASLPVRGRTPIGAPFSADFLNLVGIGSLTLYACLLTSPLYVWLARRFPIYQQRWWRNLAIHVLLTTALVLLTGVIYFQLLPRPGNNIPLPAETSASLPAKESPTTNPSRGGPPGRQRMPELGGFLLFRFFTESLPFWAMIALIHAFEFQRRVRQREFETTRLQAQLAESRLEALTAQLHPHFLFNTLQGISTLMHRDVKAADAMLSRLSDLLRQTLQRGERQEVELRDELDMLANYVEISRERFKDRLVFATRVSAGVESALVPFFILQPLVENALQHGIARRAGKGLVEVSANRLGDNLHLKVTDDGPGLPKEGSDFPHHGIGLANTRQRLQELYGGAQSLRLETPKEGGLCVEVVIPFRIDTRLSDEVKS